MQLSATPEELLAVIRELFPREYDIAFLTLTTRRQAARIADLERAISVEQLGGANDDG